MAEAVTCLLRVGNSVQKYKIAKLNRDKVTIGRNPENTYPISSNMISRCHAVIEHQGDNTWSMTDNKSSNGTFVNGQQLKPFTARTLQEGDLVQFGVPRFPDATAEFVYKFYSSLKVPIKKIGGKKIKLDSSACEDKKASSISDSFELEDCERKRKKANVKVEGSLQKEMEKALEEKNKELEQQLLNQKQKLEKVLQMKYMEQKLLENQLNETKQENVTAKLQVLKARKDVLSNFAELIEMELQCSICKELFVKGLQSERLTPSDSKSHSLDESQSGANPRNPVQPYNTVILWHPSVTNQWMKVKKECPNCRGPITSQLQAIALDSCIDKMVEQFDDEMKQKRAVFLEQRKAEQVKFDAAEAGPSCQMAGIPNTGGAGVSSGTGNRRARERHRGSFTFGGIRIGANSRTMINGKEIERGDGTDFYGGYPEAYYGGYSYCYICGLRGHWINDCPYLL